MTLKKSTKNWIIIIILFLAYNLTFYLGHSYAEWTWSLPMKEEGFRANIAGIEGFFVGAMIVFSFFKFVDS